MAVHGARPNETQDQPRLNRAHLGAFSDISNFDLLLFKTAFGAACLPRRSLGEGGHRLARPPRVSLHPSTAIASISIKKSDASAHTPIQVLVGRLSSGKNSRRAPPIASACSGL